MAIWKRSAVSEEPASGSDTERNYNEKHLPEEYQQYGPESPITEIGHLSDPAAPNESLHRGLQARQVSMIAIGGAIGTGLIIGTGTALVNTGPASIVISYSLVGMLVYVVMAALGEMATWLPAAGGFAVYADRFVDPALGFATGYTYWSVDQSLFFKYLANDISIAGSSTSSQLPIS